MTWGHPFPVASRTPTTGPIQLPPGLPPSSIGPGWAPSFPGVLTHSWCQLPAAYFKDFLRRNAHVRRNLMGNRSAQNSPLDRDGLEGTIGQSSSQEHRTGSSIITKTNEVLKHVSRELHSVVSLESSRPLNCTWVTTFWIP